MQHGTDATGVIEEILEHGYCTRPVLDAATVATLLDRFAELGIPTDREVYRTFVEEPRPVARAVDQDLKALLAPAVAALTPTHEIAVATFVFKGAHGPTIDYHQDWTFTDERTDLSVLYWIPLVDVDEECGTLGVIPGSHRWTTHLRTSSHDREGPTVVHQEAMSRAAQPLPLRAGEGIVYTPAIIHGSEPNRTDDGRPAVILITVPTGARVVHFVEAGDELLGYEVDESYFTTCDFESPPPGPRIEPWTSAVTPEDFDGPLGVHRPAPEPRPPEAPTVPAPAAAPAATPGAAPRTGRPGRLTRWIPGRR